MSLVWTPPSPTRTRKLIVVCVFQQLILSQADRLPAITLDKLRLQLLEEESRELAEHGAPYKVLAGAFFRKAFEIENHQYVSMSVLCYQHTYRFGRYTLITKSDTKTVTVQSHAVRLKLRNTLSRSLIDLRKSQRIHMPGLEPLLEDDKNLEELKLWLPSELSQDDWVVWCLPGIPELEFCFRYAQADDTLTEICRLRQTLQGLQDQNLKHPSMSQQGLSESLFYFRSFRFVNEFTR